MMKCTFVIFTALLIGSVVASGSCNEIKECGITDDDGNFMCCDFGYVISAQKCIKANSLLASQTNALKCYSYNASTYITFNSAGVASSLPCPADHSCNGISSTKCAFGMYSPIGNGKCLDCPEGHACYNGEALPCNTSKEYVHLKTMCLKCPIGGICANGSITSCKTGKYIIGDDGLVTCGTCDANLYDATTKRCNAAPDNISKGLLSGKWGCRDGFYKDDSFIPANATTDFLKLKHGCVSCPTGHSCSGNIRKVCEPGTYSDVKGLGKCNSCAVNTFSGLGASACTACPEGYVAEAGSAECTVAVVEKFNKGEMMGMALAAVLAVLLTIGAIGLVCRKSGSESGSA